MRIIFMGTPDFAVPSLQILVEAGYEVVGVVTTTDKYGGRGKKKLLESPVKKYAVSQGIPVLQPEKLRAPDFIAALEALKADLQIVVAFRMLPEVVWNMPRQGTYNLHGSLLPKYRGAAPINWAVINGDTTTGVTTFKITHQIDTGDLLYQDTLPIGENDTAGEVHDRMMEVGAKLVLKSVQAIEKGGIELKEQDDNLASKAPKLYHDTSVIDFAKSAKEVHNMVRGLSPYPAAWTMLGDKKVKILRTSVDATTQSDAIQGTILTDNKSYLKVVTGNGIVNIHELQMQGKKRLEIKPFLNGFNFEENACFSA